MAIPNETATMRVAATKTFCSGKRRARPVSDVAAARSQNKAFSQDQSSDGELPSRSAVQAMAKQTRNAMKTGLCAECAQGDGSCATPSAKNSVGEGLNSGFILDAFGLNRCY